MATSVEPLAPGLGVQAQHEAQLKAGQFRIQHCARCSKAGYYPRELCAHCGSGELRWVEPRGTGTVYAVTTVRRKADAGGDYNVSLIDLDEGVRLMSRLEGVEPAAVRIGQRVRVRLPVADALVRFEPAEGGS